MTNKNTKSECEQQLIESVRDIARRINGSDWANGETGEDALNIDGEPMNAMDYLQDALDFQFILSSDKKTLLGVRILVAFGGPNVWIDTLVGEVQGYWSSDRAVAYFGDNQELNEALETIFYC